MKMRWLPILLLCLLLAGCSVETSEGHLVPVAEGSREYSSALDPFLPGYTLREAEDTLYGELSQGNPVACFDVQAVPAMARGVGRYWYPHVSATVVLAVDRTRTDAVVTGWNSLRENRVPVGMSSTSIVRNMLVLGALSYGLNPKEPSKREALDFLEHLCQNGGFELEGSDAPILLCLDYEAAAWNRNGGDYCEAIPADVLAVKGKKKVTGRSSNSKGDDNIITNGSVIAVADGQCMLIVEQGKVVDVCAEPGEYTYDMSTEPSVFSGDLGESIQSVFLNIGKRFTFGGEAPKDQRIYYFNTKELTGNKYGTPSPVPFRVVDQRAGIDLDIAIRCFGEYSVRLRNPLLFYTNVCGNVTEDYKTDQIAGQMKTELLTALQPAFAKISEMGIRYSALPGHTLELAEALNEQLSSRWRDLRGMEIVSFGVSSVKANEEDEQMIKELQRNAAFMDPTRAAAHLVGAQASAMQSAASNPNAGPAMAFMGMGMAGQMGGMNAQNLYQMGAQQQAQPAPAPVPTPPPAAPGWTCACGQSGITGSFCPNCGSKKPEPKPAAESWQCTCGASVTGKFCPECGKPRPAADGWTCSCGAVNKGKFCAECGAKKPAGVPQYKCDKCGWEPDDPAHPPKFCPECGDPFDDGDVQG